MSNEKAHRVSVTVPADTKQVIDKLAARDKVSASAYIQKLAERGLAIEGILVEDGEVFARLADGREILLASKDRELRSSPQALNQKLLNGQEE